MGPNVVSTGRENSRAAKTGVRGQHQAGEASGYVGVRVGALQDTGPDVPRWRSQRDSVVV